MYPRADQPFRPFVPIVIAILLTGLGLLLICEAGAATYFVSPRGSDGNSCGSAQSPDSRAKRSIRAGAACLGSGDELLIQGGTYDERMAYAQGFPWQSGRGESSRTRYARATVNDVVTVMPSSGGGHVLSTYQREYIEIDGLILDATHAVAGVKWEESHHMRLLNSEVRNSKDVPSGNCILAGGVGNQVIRNKIHHCIEYGIYWTGSKGLIDGNRIYDNGGYGIHHYAGEGGVNDNVIRNNLISGNGFSSHMISGQAFSAPAVIIASGRNTQFYNNVVYKNHSGLQIWSEGTQVYHNTFVGNGDGYATGCIFNDGNWGGAQGTIIKNNLCQDNATDRIVNTGSMTSDHNLSAGGR